jgi:hypothetical protein
MPPAGPSAAMGAPPPPGIIHTIFAKNANYQQDITQTARIIDNRMIAWPSKRSRIAPGVSI